MWGNFLINRHTLAKSSRCDRSVNVEVYRYQYSSNLKLFSWLGYASVSAQIRWFAHLQEEKHQFQTYNYLFVNLLHRETSAYLNSSWPLCCQMITFPNSLTSNTMFGNKFPYNSLVKLGELLGYIIFIFYIYNCGFWLLGSKIINRSQVQLKLFHSICWVKKTAIRN